MKNDFIRSIPEKNTDGSTKLSRSDAFHVMNEICEILDTLESLDKDLAIKLANKYLKSIED